MYQVYVIHHGNLMLKSLRIKLLKPLQSQKEGPQLLNTVPNPVPQHVQRGQPIPLSQDVQMGQEGIVKQENASLITR